MPEGEALQNQQRPAEEEEEEGVACERGESLRSPRTIEYEAGCPGKPIDVDPDRCDVRCEADWQKPSGWPRLLSRSSFPEPCLPRTALTGRVSRWGALRAGLLSLLLALLAPAPDALVLADGPPAAILAPAPNALVLADA